MLLRAAGRMAGSWRWGRGQVTEVMASHVERMRAWKAVL
jgi:hypothetical protein